MKLKAGLISRVSEASDGVLIASHKMNGGTKNLIRFTNGDLKLSNDYSSYASGMRKVGGVETLVHSFTKEGQGGVKGVEHYYANGRAISSQSIR